MPWDWRGVSIRWQRRCQKLGLLRFTLRVTPVALSLSRPLVFDHRFYTGLFLALASFGFGECLALRSGSQFFCAGLNMRALLMLEPLALDASFLTSQSDGRAFRLPRRFRWFCRCLCFTVGVEKRNLGVLGCGSSVSELVFSRGLQMFILILVMHSDQRVLDRLARRAEVAAVRSANSCARRASLSLNVSASRREASDSSSSTALFFA